ncbi:unnamed protein product [Parnassius mnemosyne]|uniref:Uncharacterized protein n=1 Tax=Parnassius mnemosyne TaxID=213953 RepID=A0AAV1KBT2_9NEOP
MSNRIPDVAKCCGCVTDLKTAVAIIAVLGIVTCPAVSWVIVRHAYAIRVSCVMSTSGTRPDVIDINFRNVLSFGFGTNAGFGSSCLSPNSTHLSEHVQKLTANGSTKNSDSGIVRCVRYFGWIVLIADLVFVISCTVFLIKLFKGRDIKAGKIFMYAAMTSVVLSFLYGIFYVFVCISLGSGFPINELFFIIFDLIAWLYFVIVINAYASEMSTINQN